MSLPPTISAAVNPRAGQRTAEFLLTNVIPNSRRYRAHGGTKPPCGPTRAEIHTGKWGGLQSQDYGNNGVSDDENAPASNYVATYQTGQFSTVRNIYQGPHEHDLAFDDPDRHVPASQQVSPKRGGADDPQAWTGWLGVWLARRLNIPVGVFAKWQNGYKGTNAYAFPGVTACHICESQTAHWHTVMHEYDGANVWNGAGQATVQNTYDYNNTPTKAVWAAGVATITCAGHNLDIGDQVVVTNMPDATYNGTWTVTATATTTFSYALAATPANQNITSGFSAAGTKVYTVFEQALYTKKMVSFINAQAGGLFFAYQAPRLVHVDNDNTYDSAMDVRYKGTVNPADAFWWNDIAGGVSPVGPTLADSGATTLAGYQHAAASRQEMLASFDDHLSVVVPLMNSIYGSNWTLILTGDNGDQLGEMDIHNDGAIKNAGWEGSRRNFLYIMGPGFQPGDVVDLPTAHVDIPLTVLWQYKIFDHHAFTNRDGIAIQRLEDPTDPYHHLPRVLPVYGTMGGLISDGYIDCATFKKRMRGGKNFDFDFRPPPYGDYELAQNVRSTVGSPSPDQVFQTRADAIEAAHWNPATDSHPARTI